MSSGKNLSNLKIDKKEIELEHEEALNNNKW